jgi:hypothetical protein
MISLMNVGASSYYYCLCVDVCEDRVCRDVRVKRQKGMDECERHVGEFVTSF